MCCFAAARHGKLFRSCLAREESKVEVVPRLPILRLCQSAVSPLAFIWAWSAHFRWQEAALQLRLSIAEARERNTHLHVEVEKTRYLLQEKKNAALSASIPLEEARAEVRLELQCRQTELAVKDKELELASRKAALTAVHFELTEWQLHPQGDVAAARWAADEACLHAAKQHSEQQGQIGEGSLFPTERARLARAVLQLHQQQA